MHAPFSALIGGVCIVVAAIVVCPAVAVDVDSPYGVVAFLPSPTGWDAMRDGGILWGRCGFSWRDIETSKGVFNWAATDNAVAQANARGLHIYAGMGYTPAWASSSAYPEHRSQDPPANPQDWADFCFACVSRYKDSIQYWELWNEPNIDSQFWNDSRQHYIDNILKRGSDAVHAADPEALVLGPEISRCCDGDGWMREVLRQAGDKIDIIAFHQYDWKLPSNRLSASSLSIDQMHNLIVSEGYANKPIWVTECGWRSDESGVNETTQGQYLRAMLDGMLARPWFQKFFWYQIWEGETDFFGLLYMDQTRKPVWYDYHDYIFGNPSRSIAPHPAPERVSVNLSTTDISDGVTRVSVGDGDNVPLILLGRSCRQNVDAGDDFYMYFNVDELFVSAGNRPVLTIFCDYYDGSPGSVTLQYDSTSDPYKSAATFIIAGKNTWKQAIWTVTDAYFGNRQNGGADFRIAAPRDTTFYLDTIAVTAPPRPGPGRASNPSPAHQAAGVTINADLSWTAGSEATSYNVYFGSSYPPQSRGNQAGTTYDPGPMLPSTTYHWRIDGVNAAGTTTGDPWTFTTVPLAGTAGNPSPANGATNANATAHLSWTAGTGADSHNVYFGTTNPPASRGNQTATTYDPGTMLGGTTYYWRIDEVNGGGTTAGLLWMFTTLPLPGVAGNPNPPNGATGVSVTTDLSWTAGVGATSHDVYFGTSEPLPSLGNQTGTTYNLGTLLRGTTYYWRIDEWNASGPTTGILWHFRTGGSRADFDYDNDVDQADFAFLQACLAILVGCSDADLDGDDNVDQDDLGSWLACMGGPNQPPACP